MGEFVGAADAEVTRYARIPTSQRASDVENLCADVLLTPGLGGFCPDYAVRVRKRIKEKAIPFQ